MGSYDRRDADLIESEALPNGAAATNTDGFDIGAMSAKGIRPGDVELHLSAPALSTTLLPDTQKVTYTLQCDSVSDFASPTTIATLGSQTGAGGAGAAAVDYRLRLPTDCERYVRAVATKTGAADASSKAMTLEVLT